MKPTLRRVKRRTSQVIRRRRVPALRRGANLRAARLAARRLRQLKRQLQARLQRLRRNIENRPRQYLQAGDSPNEGNNK